LTVGTTVSRLARAIAKPLLAVVMSLVLFAIVLLIGNYNVIDVYASLVAGAVGNPGALGSTLRWATSLILAGLAVTIPLRAGLFNVGVEGQLYLAGFVAALIGIHVELPAVIVQPLVLLAAMVVGMLWALIPTLLLVYTRASEIVTTLMLNFVALGVVNYLVNNYFRTELSAAAVMTDQVRPEARFPSIFPPNPVSYGVVIAIVLAFLIQRFLRQTTYGYEIRMIGLNRDFARFGGISIRQGWFISMLASGAIAGLIGAFETNGVNGRFISGFSPGFGFDGFLIAFLAGGNPIGVILAGLGVAAMRAGSLNLAIEFGMPRITISILQGFIILLISAQLGRFDFVRRLVIERKQKIPAQGEAA
jgi:general nucleoside transport system permease protein